jgi:hypothetical protein
VEWGEHGMICAHTLRVPGVNVREENEFLLAEKAWSLVGTGSPLARGSRTISPGLASTQNSSTPLATEGNLKTHTALRTRRRFILRLRKQSGRPRKCVDSAPLQDGMKKEGDDPMDSWIHVFCMR